jgi:small-conductance mechanosensitive channel
VEEFIYWLKKVWLYAGHPLFEVSQTKISLISFIFILAIVWATFITAKLVQRAVERYLTDKNVAAGPRASISRLTRYTVITVGIITALDTAGISLTSLAALGAVLMVGIGFGLQNIAQNFIAGIILLFERPVSVGDIVQVQGINGKVIDIGARSTIIQTRDDITIIVPNSQFISEQVINESFTGTRIRVCANVGVAYGSDIEKVKSTLLEVAQRHPKILKTPAPGVGFSNFGDSSLDFGLYVWIEDLWEKGAILSDLRFEMERLFREREIEIPFPQRDIHIKSQPRT